ncbi:MAG TPA: hypothetical protein VNH11_06995 [Pirellulales bacterium]|nr:hypothetical protein [Pirellulales bacterium]
MEVELRFQGGIRNGRMLRGRRAAKVFAMTDEGRVGATFKAGRMLHHDMSGKRSKVILSVPYAERYVIMERKQLANYVKLVARHVRLLAKT